MATGTPAPWFMLQFFDNNGDPLAAGLIDTYLAGTTTAEPTYTDVGLTVANANPIVLDAAGRATIFLAAKSYKFRLRTSAGVVIRTEDNIASVALNTNLIGQGAEFGGVVGYMTYDAAYPTGATYDKLARGTMIVRVDPATMVGTYKLEAIVQSDTPAGRPTIALVNLTDGSPNTAMTGSEVSASADCQTGEYVLSGAITLPAGGSSKDFGVKIHSNAAANGANVYGARLVRSA